MTDTAAAVDSWVESCEVDRRLKLKPAVGEVVENVKDGTRGVVVSTVAVGSLPMYVTDFAVKLSPGHHRISNRVDDWRVVPERERTAVERVQSVMAAYDPHTWSEDYEWHLLGALLPPAELEEWADGCSDWPDANDLALLVARRIDATAGGSNGT